MTAFGTLRCLGAGLLLFALCSLLVSKPMLDRQDCSTTAPSAASASSSKPIPSPRPAEAFHFEAFVGMPSSGLETPAVLPRAMKAPGCDLPLLCGWSLAQPVQDDAFLKVTVTWTSGHFSEVFFSRSQVFGHVFHFFRVLARFLFLVSKCLNLFFICKSSWTTSDPF